MGELTAVGIGIGFFTLEDKEKFLDTGVFSFDSAQSLLNTKFYYKGKSLEGSKSLDADQYEIKTNPEN